LIAQEGTKLATWFQRILTIGNTGADVSLVQRKLKALNTGVYDRETAARVRGLQHERSLPATGIVDYATSDAIGESVRLGMPPDWYGHELGLWATGADVERLRELLGLEPHGRFDRDVEAAVRRFQSAHRLPLTGRVTQTDATVLGDDAPWRGGVDAMFA
jgi:peptidoglycan hydrolase-like protein with peptidoglycan-binding domain